MRSLMALDTVDLRSQTCPWCGQAPRGATFGLKAVRDGDTLGLIAVTPGSDLGGAYPADGWVIRQAWVRPQDVHELIGTQLIHRLAAIGVDQRARCIIAAGTPAHPDCHHLPAAFLEGLGFTPAVMGHQWRLDLRRTLPLGSVIRGVMDAASRLMRPVRPTAAGRG